MTSFGFALAATTCWVGYVIGRREQHHLEHAKCRRQIAHWTRRAKSAETTVVHMSNVRLLP